MQSGIIKKDFKNTDPANNLAKRAFNLHWYLIRVSNLKSIFLYTNLFVLILLRYIIINLHILSFFYHHKKIILIKKIYFVSFFFTNPVGFMLYKQPRVTCMFLHNSYWLHLVKQHRFFFFANTYTILGLTDDTD